MTLFVGSMLPEGIEASVGVARGAGKRVDWVVPWVVSEDLDEGADWIE